MNQQKCKPYNQEGYVIRVAEKALILMCHSGLEAYSVKHQGTRCAVGRLETYGLLWGSETSMADGRTLYSVELLSPDTSAVRAHDWIRPEIAALELKRDLMTSFWPQYDFLGNFHTHPYKSASDVPVDRLYEFSPKDFRWIEENECWLDHGYRVGLALTIAPLKRKGSRKSARLDANTLEFTMGNYRMWLKGYVAHLEDDHLKLTAHSDDQVCVECPGLLGLPEEFTPFGRVVSRVGGVAHCLGMV